MLIRLCTEFGEDILFRSRVIAFFVKLPLHFRTFWGTIATASRNFNFVLITIDIHCPENISQYKNINTTTTTTNNNNNSMNI